MPSASCRDRGGGRLRRLGILGILLVTLSWPFASGSESALSYEGNAHAASVGSSRTLGAETAASAEAFRRESSAQGVTDGPLAVHAGRAEFEGAKGEMTARYTAAYVRADVVPGLRIEARGVRSMASASCAAGRSTASVDALFVNGLPVRSDAVALPGGAYLVVADSSRSASSARQVVDAVRVHDSAGRTLATIGHAEAVAVSCARVEPQACAGFTPVAVADLRVGDAAMGGPQEMTLSGPTGPLAQEDFAWQNGVWTHARVSHDPTRGTLSVTLRGVRTVTVDVPPGPLDALLFTVDATEGRARVADLHVQDLAVAGELDTAGASQLAMVRSPLLSSSYAATASVRLDWDASSPPPAEAIGVRVVAGRCP